MRRSLVRVPCPLCANPDGAPVFEVRDWMFKITDDRFVVQRCSNCGCGYVSPRPAEETLARYYPREFYWSHEGATESISWDQVIAARTDQLEAKASTLAGVTPGRLLDIGAQKGDFLWYMQQRGWQCTGVEIDNQVPNPMDQPIRYGDFLELQFDEERFDAITAWAVLEHVYRPAQFVEKAARLLVPGGRLIALVTNFNSIQGRFLAADDYPRHLTLFTSKSIRDLAERNGLIVRRLWTDQRIFGGSLNGALVYMAKRMGGYSRDEALSEWRQIGDPLSFCAKWRGERSATILNLSRMDRALTWLPERLLDALGYGFILTFVLEKPLGRLRSRHAS